MCAHVRIRVCVCVFIFLHEEGLERTLREMAAPETDLRFLLCLDCKLLISFLIVLQSEGLGVLGVAVNSLWHALVRWETGKR